MLQHEGCYLEALVDQALLVQSAEDPPHALHEARVQSLVAVVKIDPPPNALYSLLPFLGVPAVRQAGKLASQG